MWIDSHCHITADRFDEDREAAIARALGAGVDLLVAIGSGYGLEHNELAARLAEGNGQIFATAGLQGQAMPQERTGRRGLHGPDPPS